MAFFLLSFIESKETINEVVHNGIEEKSPSREKTKISMSTKNSPTTPGQKTPSEKKPTVRLTENNFRISLVVSE